MKKIILVAALILGFAAAAAAQPRAVGLRGGALSYQHTLGSNFAEVDLGFLGAGLSVDATYNTSFYKPDWTKKGTWNAYWGYGAGLDLYGGVGVNALAQVGLEYTFWFPLQLSFDLRPQVGFHTAFGVNFGFGPSFGVRYKF